MAKERALIAKADLLAEEVQPAGGMQLDQARQNSRRNSLPRTRTGSRKAGFDDTQR